MVPNEHDLRAAARILNEGKRIAMLVGAGALGATDEVIAVADRLGAGCAKALLGLAVVPDDLPWVTGAIGLLGTKPSSDMMQDCDTLLDGRVVVSVHRVLAEAEGRARGVQIDLDPTMIGLRHPMEANLVGDASDTLRALVPLLDSKRDRVLAREDSRTASSSGARRSPRAGKSTRFADQPAAPSSESSRRASRTERSSPFDSGAVVELRRARRAPAPRDDGERLGRARFDGSAVFRTPSRRSSRIPSAP